MGQRPQFHSIPLRKSAPQRHTTIQTPLPNHSYVARAAVPTMPDDDQMYVTRATPTSAIRYTDPYGRDVRQQGRRRVVVKHVRARPRVHWLFHASVGMLAMLALMVGGMWSIDVWNAHQLDATYGFPRHYEVNQVVGHGDSALHPSHFVFENLSGHVLFIEFPAGDIAKAKIYAVSTLVGDDAANWPVTATFKDINGDGRIDLLVHIQDQTIVYLNDGTGFKLQQPQ